MVKKMINAIYENGLLRPLAPLYLEEGATVIVSLEENTDSSDLLALAQSVYDGLSSEEVQEVEEIALKRDDFFRNR
jgi:predicted DNA-binding antitoxin AbrB/MazE fold protein